MEEGTHDELLSIRGGKYSEMWHMQVSDDDDDEEEATTTAGSNEFQP